LKRTIAISALLAASLLSAGEMRYASGTFELEGGFLGLGSKKDTDISAYSLVQQHKNLFSSRWYYSYNVTWYDSDRLLQAQQTLDTGTTQLLPDNPFGSTTSTVAIPAMSYRYQGLDAQGVIGYDLLHTSERDFFGAGLLLGISAPWIDSEKDSDNTTNDTDVIADAFEKSKTKILTYRIGPSFTFRKSLGEYFSLYGSATIAYQTGTIENDYAGTDISVNGRFDELDMGIRFQPLSYDKSFGWFTLSPRLYATLGYRYTHWEYKDVAIDTSGAGITFAKNDMKMSASTAYFGVGYAF